MLLRSQGHSVRNASTEDHPDPENDDDRFMDRRSKQEFQKLLQEGGLDRSDVDIYGLANGKQNAIQLLAVQLGVDPSVLQLVVSVARRNQDALLEAAQEIGPKLGIDGTLARSIVNLANSWSKESGRQGIKQLVNTLADSSLEKSNFVVVGGRSPFQDPRDPEIEKTLQILPTIAESLLAITEDRDFEPLVELLDENKVTRDAFKPVPMQVFRFLQDLFAQNDEGIRRSLLRACERLLIADACTLKVKEASQRIALSKVVEHLGDKLGCHRQLATVLHDAGAHHVHPLGSNRLAPLMGGGRHGIPSKMGHLERHMIQSLFDGVELSNDHSIHSKMRPVQHVRAWLRGKAVTKGQIVPAGRQYVQTYQVMTLLDGLFCVWSQSPVELLTAPEFCRQVLSLEPSVASALLALMCAEEGGVNPDTSEGRSHVLMRARIIHPLCKQIALDLGASKIFESSSGIPRGQLERYLQQVFEACLAISRGRQIDFTKFVLASGIPRASGATIIGSLMCGQIKAPLWKQLTPLCNQLGIADPSVIIAVAQLRRQAQMGDYMLGANTLLAKIGVVHDDIRDACRWILQLAIARNRTHVQRALIHTIPGAERGDSVRTMSMKLVRRRRQALPSGGLWYHSGGGGDPHDAEASQHELKNSNIDDFPGDISHLPTIQVLTRVKVRAIEHQTISTSLAKDFFWDFIASRYRHLENFTEALASKLFDLITFVLQLGEDVPSLKSMALTFKIKADLLRALVQVPLYATDQPLRKVIRPRSAQRAEQATSLMRDHLGLDPACVFKFNDLVSKSRREVYQNDTSLHELCWALDKTKESFMPRAWYYVQCLTMPTDEQYQGFTSRGLYALLNLERPGWSADDNKNFAGEYLTNAQVLKAHPSRRSLHTDSALDTLWKDHVRCALRGLIGCATGNMAQVIAFLHAASWLNSGHGPGLAIKFALSTIWGNAGHLKEFLRLQQSDTTTRPTLLDVAHALTRGDSSEANVVAYAQAIEAICAITMFRRSGDPQSDLQSTFEGAIRHIPDKLDVNNDILNAVLAASVGDSATYRDSLLEMFQDELGMSPVVAGGLYSIGSGDIKGIQELAELIDIDANIAEGIVALAAGTSAATRGCLPSLLNGLEINVNAAMGIFGIINDDATSIASLAHSLTEARPEHFEAVNSSLVCIPGLFSNNRDRIAAALDGLQSNSKLSFTNINEATTAILLLTGNTYAVRSALGMRKLELDLAALLAHLFKVNATRFCSHPSVDNETAQQWCQYMSGQTKKASDEGPEELGAESFWAHLMSGVLPNLFQRIAGSIGMVPTISRSSVRAAHDKSDPQHPARPWAMTSIGFLITGFYYAGVTGRFARLLEALDLEHTESSGSLPALRAMLEAPGGFREVIDIAFHPGNNIVAMIIHDDAEKRTRAKQEKYTVPDIVRKVLQRIMRVPPQLKEDNPPGVNSVSYAELQGYLRRKLQFEAENTIKFLMFIYRFGTFSMTPPPVVDNVSKMKMQLTLRWAIFDGEVYKVERGNDAGSTDTLEFMHDVDWEHAASSETISDWRALYFLAAQIVATSLLSFDDDRASPLFDIVNDTPTRRYVNALRYRRDTTTNTRQTHSVLERRRILAKEVENIEDAGVKLNFKRTSKSSALTPRDCRRKMIKSITHILEVADGLTASSIRKYGKHVGGHVFSLLWNDPSHGHSALAEKTASMIHLPPKFAEVIVAMAARKANHPALLPRFVSEFYPLGAELRPSDPLFVAEGEGTPGESRGRPPRIRTDATGTPEVETPVPPPLVKLFKALDVVGEKCEPLYQLVRVSIGDLAFLALNRHSVSNRLKVPVSLCRGLSAGALLRSAAKFAEPDVARINVAVERLAVDLGVAESIASKAVSASSGNIHQLRELAILLNTKVAHRQPGGTGSSAAVRLENLRREGATRGLFGLVTGEKAELTQPCRISADGAQLLDNIDIVCHELVKDIFPHKAGMFAQNLRCIAGLALADADLVCCSLKPLRGARNLHHLVPLASRHDDTRQTPSIIRSFETAVTGRGKTARHRHLFEGILDLHTMDPLSLVEKARNLESNIWTDSSWLSYFTSGKLWDMGSFSGLCFQIAMCFAGNDVRSNKAVGLVPLMDILRPDLAATTTTMSIWHFLERMASHRLGRGAEATMDVPTFKAMLHAMYDGSVVAVRRAPVGGLPRESNGWGLEIAEEGSGQVSVVNGGGGYSVGDCVMCSTCVVEVTETSDFTLSQAAIECILRIVADDWSHISGIAPDEVSSQLQISPPPARRVDPSIDPKSIPGWKLLRETDTRSLPPLVVGSGRRPLLSLRRLRAFINLGQHKVVNLAPDDFQRLDVSVNSVLGATSRPLVTMATEVFALLEGSTLAPTLKQSLLTMISLLNRDVTRLAGLYKCNPYIMVGMLESLLKPAITSANSERALKDVLRIVEPSDSERGIREEQEAEEAVPANGSGGIADAAKAAAAEATQRAKEKDVAKWKMVRRLIDMVLTEYEFDVADPSDPSSGPRRARLYEIFENVPDLGQLVHPLRDPKQIQSAPLNVLTSAFRKIISGTCAELNRMVSASQEQVSKITSTVALPSSMTTERHDAHKIHNDVMASEQDANDIDRLNCLAVVDDLVEFLVGLERMRSYAGLCSALRLLAQNLSSVQTRTSREERPKAFLSPEGLGELFCNSGFSKDLPELAHLDGSHFWAEIATLFVSMRCAPGHPEKIAADDITLGMQWSRAVADRLSTMMSVSDRGGLLYEALAENERNALQVVEAELRPRIASMSGTMSHREKSTWFREQAMQILEEKANIGGISSHSNHPLLGTALFLFDVWSFRPSASPGKQTQQSLYRLRRTVKEAVQIVIEAAVKNTSKGVSSAAKRNIAKQRIALGHTYVQALFELPRVIAGPLERAWDDASRTWKEHMTIQWGELTLRLLSCTAELAGAVEKACGVPPSQSVSELVTVLRDLRSVRNSYGPALTLAQVLADYSLDLETTSVQPEAEPLFTLELGGEAGSAVEGKRPRTPANFLRAVTTQLLHFLAYRQIISDEKIRVASELVATLYIPGDDGQTPLPPHILRPRALRLLQILEKWLQLDTEVVDEDLNRRGIPLYALFLTEEVIREGIVANNFVHRVLYRNGHVTLNFEEDFASERALLRAHAIETGPDQSDALVRLSVHFFPIPDPALKAKIAALLCDHDIRIDSILQMLSHPAMSLLPEAGFGSMANLRNAVANEASALVARIPQLFVSQAIAQAKEKSIPLLRMVGNAVAKVLDWGLSKGRTIESLREMLLQLKGDQLPEAMREHVTKPIIDMLNGDTGLVTLIRADIGETIKKDRVIAMTQSLVTNLGQFVYGLTEAEAAQVVNACCNIARLDASATHESKLNTLVNEMKLLDSSAEISTSLCLDNGMKAATVTYLLALIKAIYRARWLYNSANFERYTFAPDAEEKVPGHVAARGMCMLMECRGTISKYHSSAVRAVLLICAAAANWEKERQPGTPPGHFLWKASTEARSVGLTNPATIARLLKTLFDDLTRLTHPLLNEWDAPPVVWSDIAPFLSADPGNFAIMRDEVRRAHQQGTPLIDVPDLHTGLDSTIDAMCAVHARLDALKSALKIFLREAVACYFQADVVNEVLTLVSSVPLVVRGERMLGPSSAQISVLVDQLVPDNPADWPQYGSVDKMVDFVVSRSHLVDLSERAFKVLPGHDEARARLTPAQAVEKSRDSLRKCFMGCHTGRDYATNVVFPLVRMLHDRWGLYGNISLLDSLTVRGLIDAEIERKQNESAAAQRNVATLDESEDERLEAEVRKKTGHFPTFDLFAGNSERGEMLIHATKALLYKKHTDPDMQANADTVGHWMVAIMRLHQKLVHAINEAQDDDDDVERLLDTCAPSVSLQSPSVLDSVLYSAMEMVGAMTVNVHEVNITAALGEITHQALVLRGDVTSTNAVSEHFEIKTNADGATVQVVDNSPAHRLLGPISESARVTSIASVEVALSIVLHKVLVRVLCHATLARREDLAEFNQRRARANSSTSLFALLVDTLKAKIEMVLNLYRWCGGSTLAFDEPEASTEGWAVKRLLVMHHRCLLSYLWWYLSMRQYKYAWLKKLVYRMPQALRESDTFESVPSVSASEHGEFSLSPNHLFVGQFGLLQYARRVGHLAFNLKRSGLQRAISEVPMLIMKLMELQRGMEINLEPDRRPQDPEVVRESLSQRVTLVDTFAIDVMHCHGILAPLIDCIYLNRMLLTGTGLQSPAAFSTEYMKLATANVSPILSVVPRVSPDLCPQRSGSVQRVSRSSLHDVRGDAESINGSLLDDLNMGGDGSGYAADAFSVISGPTAGSDARSIRSAGSVGSTTGKGGSSKKDVSVKDHPVMEFIPMAVSIFSELACTLCDVYTWDVFEKSVRSAVVESVLRACNVDLESPFLNLAIDARLRKVIESTMAMAVAEENDGDSRDYALQISGLSGQLLGLNGNLMDGILAVLDKNMSRRQNGLAKLGNFLADSGGNATDATVTSATISGLVALSTGDWEGGRLTAVKLGVFNTKTIGRVFAFVGAMHKAGLRGDDHIVRLPVDPVGGIHGELSAEKLFDAFDLDGAGLMSFKEFEIAFKYLVYPKRLTRVVVYRLFTRADRDNTGELTLPQFKLALESFATELSAKVLERQGLSEGRLAATLFSEICLLLLVMVFILLGISAFTTAGGFESTVSALLPLAAGGGIALQISDDDDDDGTIDLDDEVERSISSMSETD